MSDPDEFHLMEEAPDVSTHDEKIAKAGGRVALAEMRYQSLGLLNTYGKTAVERAEMEIQYEAAFREMVAAKAELRRLILTKMGAR